MNDLPPPIGNDATQPIFFPVSGLKLVVMSIVTFGLYELYWFYRNWKFIRERKWRDIMPFWRAFFGFFFCYPLFREIRDSAASASIPERFPAGLLAIAWIGLTLCWRLPDPYWLVDNLAIAALLPVQKAVNELNARFAPGPAPNSCFSAWNIAAIVVGGLVFALAMIGAFLPQ